MATVTPAMIQELRVRTGVGMSKCKEALEESKGDLDLAVDLLRKAGIASAVKKEGRETKEGMIGIGESAHAIALVEVLAETDFVVKNEKFQQFLSDMVQEVAANTPASVEALLQQKYSKDQQLTNDQYRATLIQIVGENVQVRRLMTIAKSTNKSVGIYSHQGGKIVTVVELEGAANEESFAKEIAMHVAAAAPDYLSPEKVPATLVEHEKEIARSQAENKPAFVVDKIIDGKLNAFYDSMCLLRQKYVKDDSLSVGEVVEKHAKAVGKPLRLTNFLRWSVGQ